MTCKRCGNKYYTTVCPCVLNPSYAKDTPKKKYLFKAFIITLSAVALIGIVGAGIYEINRLNNLVIEKDKKIIALKSNNEYLTSKINRDKNIINRLSKQNHQPRNNRNTLRASTNKTRIYTQPKTYTKKAPTYTKPKQDNKTTIIYDKSVSKVAKTYNKPVQKTSTKRYQRFSKNIKLVSDSKITMNNDNRLTSNAYILGRYYKKDILSTKCGNNEDIYKVINECRIKLLHGFDTVYSSKSNLKRIKSFNRNTHMIECKYNKEHGLMQDCSIKLIGVM